MPRPLRHFQPRTLFEVTTRTVQSRLLLRPSVPLREIVLGVLGRAQRLHALDLHLFTFASNHYHLLCSPDSPEQLATFMCFLNSNLAREVGRLHDWREKFWGRRYRAIAVSGEEAAQVERVRYLLSHGCKEGFVDSPQEWPGAHCVDALLDGSVLEGLWFDRTLEFEARRRGIEFGARTFAATETVTLSRMPCWSHLDERQARDRARELVAEIVTETARRNLAAGRTSVGASFVEHQNPHARPVRSKRSPAPAVHAASRLVRRAMTQAYRAFLAAYRRAADRMRTGDLSAAFPDYCFPPALPPVRGPAAVGWTG